MKIDYGRRTKTADSFVSRFKHFTFNTTVPVTFVFSRIKRFRDPSWLRLYPIRNRFSNSLTRIFIKIFFLLFRATGYLPNDRRTCAVVLRRYMRFVTRRAWWRRMEKKTVILTVRAILCRYVWRRREGKNTQFVFYNVEEFISFSRWTSSRWG